MVSPVPLLQVGGQTEMLTSILIISISIVLLVYWFRYSCILLLRGYAEQPIALPADSRFSFVTVRERLREAPELDPLHLALQRDYQIITFLFRHAPTLELSSFEDRLLLWDYRAMQCWYRLTRTAAPEQARQALSEMASVLAILGGKIGERSGAQAEA